MVERLQKFLATAGIASRRDCKELIKQGRVRVDGEVVTDTGYKLDPSDHVVSVNGKKVAQPRLVYLVMNKPKGVVTTLEDPQRRRTVKDFLPDLDARVKPAGRLDYHSEGLLLFTNDGELIEQLTHPRFGVWKTYLVEAKGKVEQKQIRALASGVVIEGRRTAKARVGEAKFDAIRNRSQVEISIHEGRKHQVRLMFRAVGLLVVSLRRTKIGPIQLGSLKTGQCRMISQQELKRLRIEIGLD